MLDRLVFTTLEKVSDEQQAAVVIANVTYSHEVIRIAARMEQKNPKFADEPKVKHLKFSSSWIRGLLARVAMRPRRITAQLKILPSPQVVQEAMKDIQDAIKAGGFTLEEIFNGDETGMLFGAPPKIQYVPLSADRATSPESDDKARFTAFLYGSAAGKMAPVFCIIKCQSKNPYDLSKTTVVAKLLKTDYFSAAKGWELRTWSRTMALPNAKKELKEVECKRPYLINLITKDIITCQNKAWMDSAGIAMWCDLDFGPRTKAATGKALMVWDNCGPHKVESVRAVFREWGVQVMELPPKMTDILQVMDLIANAPLKSAIRKRRAIGLFAYFQEWKVRRLLAEKDGAELPPFSPPKPTLVSGLQATLECVESSLRADRFQAAMRRTFVKVGLAPQEDGQYACYKAHKKAGWMKQAGDARDGDGHRVHGRGKRGCAWIGGGHPGRNRHGVCSIASSC